MAHWRQKDTPTAGFDSLNGRAQSWQDSAGWPVIAIGLASIAELSVDVAQAIARARAEEREACLSDIQRAESGCTATTSAFTALWKAKRNIRARGEGGKA